MKRLSIFHRARSAFAAHKAWGTVMILAIIAVGYYWYRSASTANAEPQYTLSRARAGSIIQTVTGTGQVSASNQLDVTAQASGAIVSVNASVGQHVNAGQLLAVIDHRDADISLQNAQIALEKLTQPAKPSDMASTEDALNKSYSDAFNGISSFFLDMPAAMSGLNDMLYGQGAFLSNASSQYSSLSSTAQNYRDDAGRSYDAANDQYDTVVQEYKSLNRNSATSSIASLLEDSYSLAKNAATALQKAQNAVHYIVVNQPNYMATAAQTATANVNGWSSQINSDLSSLLASKNAIRSNQDALDNLINGADPLDIRSQQLALRQQQQNYQNYFVRAPFAGIVGRIPVSIYGQAGSGTVIATIIGDQKIANISLNEVDAAKVKNDDPVRITFDAIDGLNATGTVSEVDLVGTVSQGVVSYNVKIAINTEDSRILPGMSVSTVIVTNEMDNVLTVPASAVKTQGSRSYVQVFDALPAGATSTVPTSAARNGTSTRSGNGFNRSSNQSRTITVTSANPPRDQTVTVGASDDNNAQILSGLNGGEWVVAKTTASAAAKAATAPSILNSLGGARTGGGAAGGGAFRAATGR